MSEAEEVAKIVHVTLGAQKVLAAPAEAVAEHLKARMKARLDRTLTKSRAKKKGKDPAVSDRVAAKVLNEAAFTDDDLTLEYLAGVMAASGPDDDTGAAVVAQIARLSAMQLRFHYIVYRELRRLWPTDTPLNLYMDNEAATAGIRFTIDDLLAAIGEGGIGHIGSTIPVLHREGLIAGRYDFSGEVDNPTMITVRVRPSALGAELFLWGHGMQLGAHALFDPSVELSDPGIPSTPGASLLQPPP